MNTLEQQYRELCQEIEEHNRRYYLEYAPTISDQAYDELVSRLVAMEQAHPDLVQPFSPTQKVGAELPKGEGFAKVSHEVPLLSLSNTYDMEGVEVFFKRILFEDVRRVDERFPEERVEMTVEPKFDGISIELLYEDGVFSRAVTRGDGLVGDDITTNVRTIKELPMLLRPPYPERLLVRGEIYMTFETFSSLNEQRLLDQERPFMNPRNAAGGALHLKDPAEVARRDLRCFVYDVLTTHTEYPNHLAILEALREMGFPVEQNIRAVDLRSATLDAVEEIIDWWRERREGLPYPMDGLVFKVNSLSQRAILGTNIKDPKWGFAFKFPADRLSTTLLDVELNVGRTGAVTPVAILDPVLLDGSRVSRASLHNFDYVAEKDLMIGDEVVVEKAAEIIPQVVERVKRGENPQPIGIPENCPQCETPLIRKVLKERQTSDGELETTYEKVLRCPNPLCPARLEQALIYFVKRDNMNMDAVGEKLIGQLYSKGFVRTPADFYELKRADLLTLERMGEKLADKVLLSIEKSRQVSFDRLLSALGIPGIGKSNARLLAAFFVSPAHILQIEEEEAQELMERLKSVDGIGEVLARDFVDWLFAKGVRSELERLLGHLTTSSPHVPQGGALKGKSFCVTGTLSKPRGEIHAAIEELGGEVRKSVSKNLDYLVCGEKAGSKRAKAEKLGVTILSEAELGELCGNAGVEEEVKGEPSLGPLFD